MTWGRGGRGSGRGGRGTWDVGRDVGGDVGTWGDREQPPHAQLVQGRPAPQLLRQQHHNVLPPRRRVARRAPHHPPRLRQRAPPRQRVAPQLPPRPPAALAVPTAAELLISLPRPTPPPTAHTETPPDGRCECRDFALCAPPLPKRHCCAPAGFRRGPLLRPGRRRHPGLRPHDPGCVVHRGTRDDRPEAGAAQRARPPGARP